MARCVLVMLSRLDPTRRQTPPQLRRLSTEVQENVRRGRSRSSGGQRVGGGGISEWLHGPSQRSAGWDRVGRRSAIMTLLFDVSNIRVSVMPPSAHLLWPRLGSPSRLKAPCLPSTSLGHNRARLRASPRTRGRLEGAH
jgi:hypothetical protein